MKFHLHPTMDFKRIIKLLYYDWVIFSNTFLLPLMIINIGFEKCNIYIYTDYTALEKNCSFFLKKTDWDQCANIRRRRSWRRKKKNGTRVSTYRAGHSRRTLILPAWVRANCPGDWWANGRRGADVVAYPPVVPFNANINLKRRNNNNKQNNI